MVKFEGINCNDVVGLLISSGVQKMAGKKGRSGRKRHEPPLIRRFVRLTDEQARLVRMWGRGDLSAGLRWLITAAAPMIRRVDETETDDPRSSE